MRQSAADYTTVILHARLNLAGVRVPTLVGLFTLEEMPD